jgi:Fic family protein
MDKTLFREGDSSGELVPIAAPEPDWAFVPRPLPAKWAPTPDLVPLLVDARQRLARLDGAGRYLPGTSLLLRPLQRREALRSSALEGTFATAEELLAYGLEPREPTSSTDPVNAWREVFNYDAALQQAQALLKDLPLTSRVIRDLHRTLLDGVRGTDPTPGMFRQRQVFIGSTRRFIPTPHENVERLIAELERYMNEPDGADPLVRAYLVHYQFETIHPFRDGNGRVGRLLLSLMAFRECQLQSPWLYLSPYFERHKDEYIDRLFAVSTHGDWRGWIELCLRATVAEATDALARIDRLLALKAQYEQLLARERRSSVRLQQIVVSLLSSPLTTVTALSREFGVSFPTASQDIRKLTALGILRESTRAAKPQYYVAHEFFAAAYSEDER